MADLLRGLRRGSRADFDRLFDAFFALTYYHREIAGGTPSPLPERQRITAQVLDRLFRELLDADDAGPGGRSQEPGEAAAHPSPDHVWAARVLELSGALARPPGDEERRGP